MIGNYIMPFRAALIDSFRDAAHELPLLTMKSGWQYWDGPNWGPLHLIEAANWDGYVLSWWGSPFAGYAPPLSAFPLRRIAQTKSMAYSGPWGSVVVWSEGFQPLSAKLHFTKYPPTLSHPHTYFGWGPHIKTFDGAFTYAGVGTSSGGWVTWPPIDDYDEIPGNLPIAGNISRMARTIIRAQHPPKWWAFVTSCGTPGHVTYVMDWNWVRYYNNWDAYGNQLKDRDPSATPVLGSNSHPLPGGTITTGSSSALGQDYTTYTVKPSPPGAMGA